MDITVPCAILLADGILFTFPGSKSEGDHRKRMFDSFQPFFVKKLKERNVCCCIYDVEIEELRVGFNYMRSNCGMHDQIACKCGSHSPCS